MKAPPSLRRLARLPLAPLAALLIAAASGFFLAAMPIELLERTVVRLHIPAFFHPAQPPLGAKAHALLVALAAIGAGGVTFAAFLLLGRKRAPKPAVVVPPAPEAFDAAEPATPALRRADAHPDAPARRPIFAAADLGAPLDLADALPATWDAPPEETPPPATWAPLVRSADPAVEATPAFEASAAEPVAAEPAAEPESLSALLARLEAGLARRERAAASESPLPIRAPVSIESALPDSAADDSMDAALRRALDDLQRMAARL